jgi:hypothetical protein
MKKRDRSISPKQASDFVENFSRHCSDTGITNLGIQLIPKSDKYRQNYDRIFGRRKNA